MLAGALVRSHPERKHPLVLIKFVYRLAYRSMPSCSPWTVSRQAWPFKATKSIANLSQTRMQVFAASPAAIYSGVGNAFTKIASTEGIRALWRGVSSVILGAGPAHAVHFGTLEAVKELAGGNEAGNQWLATGESCDRSRLRRNF